MVNREKKLALENQRDAEIADIEEKYRRLIYPLIHRFTSEELVKRGWVKKYRDLDEFFDNTKEFYKMFSTEHNIELERSVLLHRNGTLNVFGMKGAGRVICDLEDLEYYFDNSK